MRNKSLPHPECPPNLFSVNLPDKLLRHTSSNIMQNQLYMLMFVQHFLNTMFYTNALISTNKHEALM